MDESKWKKQVGQFEVRAAYIPHTQRCETPPPATGNETPHYYSCLAITPMDYAEKNKMTFTEGCVVKYVSRHRKKGGADDLRKAMECIKALARREYGVEL
jgi:hypothetical protein